MGVAQSENDTCVAPQRFGALAAVNPTHTQNTFVSEAERHRDMKDHSFQLTEWQTGYDDMVGDPLQLLSNLTGNVLGDTIGFWTGRGRALGNWHLPSVHVAVGSACPGSAFAQENALCIQQRGA